MISLSVVNMYMHNFFTSLCISLFITDCYSDCLTSYNSFTNILVLKNNDILYSTYGSGKIFTKDDDSITLACPGSRIKHLNVEQAQFICYNSLYTYKDQAYSFEEISCIDTITAIEQRNNNCGNGNFLLQIGFMLSNYVFLPQIEMCWDNTRKRTLHAIATIKKNIGECHVEANTTFRSGEYFTSSLKDWYTKHGQVYNLCRRYSQIPNQIDVFNNLLEIGHLVGKCDFVYEVQQRLTFQYTNSAPRWKSFNEGNWKLLETDIRKLAVDEDTDLKVYTGTYDILKINGKDYYLNDNEIPVPKYFWKIVIKEDSKLALAILGSNDIFEAPRLNPCTNIINQVNWLTKTNAKLVSNGYMIACDLNEFKMVPGLINTLPRFPVMGKLLGKP